MVRQAPVMDVCVCVCVCVIMAPIQNFLQYTMEASSMCLRPHDGVCILRVLPHPLSLSLSLSLSVQDHHFLSDILPLCQLSPGGRGLDKDTAMETGVCGSCSTIVCGSCSTVLCGSCSTIVCGSCSTIVCGSCSTVLCGSQYILYCW